MEDFVRQTLLYDLYGDLLTPHQRAVYEAVTFEDLSLSEAAQQYGISRQGVHDLVRRVDKILGGYEDKLHLVDRLLSARECARQIRESVRKMEAAGPAQREELDRLLEQTDRLAELI